ncbi:hypothetical protein LSTR_LSTR010452 [Laodelphax striatellus]|uniref:Secreted protein n=1 Tax=Laodelphax striatellus TaxID=195883 RepID=A0A482WUT2_LAOST|nr:hypothetical protein LSTR_LSTR010452 [Laodelphax striatellus]
MSRIREGGVARDKKLFLLLHLLLLNELLWAWPCVTNRVGDSSNLPPVECREFAKGVARDKKLFLLLQPVASE